MEGTVTRSLTFLLILGLAGCSDAEQPKPPVDPSAVPPPAAREREQPSTRLDSLMELGQRSYDEGEYEAARDLFDQAVRSSRAVGDTTTLARSLTSFGFSNYWLGDYEAARRAGTVSLDIKQQHGFDELLFRSYNLLGLTAYSESRLPEATDLHESGLAVAWAANDTVNLAKGFNNLALILQELGDFPAARRNLLAAVEAAHATRERRTEGRALNNLAVLEIQVGNPLAAIEYLERARPVMEEAADVTGEQNLLGQMGSAYAALGNPARAITYLDSALQRSRLQGLRQEEASNLEQLAEVYRNVGEYGHAIELFAKAREINEEVGLVEEIGIDLRAEAEIYASLGNLDLALRQAGEALQIHREIGASYEEFADLLTLAELTQEAGRPDETSAYLEAAREVARTLEARTARVAVAIAEARIAERNGRPHHVLRIIEAARTDLARGSHDTEWVASALRARAHAALGNWDEAVSAGRAAVAAVERVRRQLGGRGLRTSFASERQSSYAELAAALLETGRMREAFEVSDAARGRALLDRLTMVGSDAEPDGRQTVAELAGGRTLLLQIDSLLVRTGEIEERLAGEQDSDLSLQATRLTGELERARREYEASLLRAEQSDPQGLALLGAASASADDVQAALRPDEALLEFLVTDERVVVFVVTPDLLRVLETTVPRANLANRVRIVRELISRPGAPTERTAAAVEGLFDALIAPVQRAGYLEDAHRLIVVPHAELNYLPFAALRDRDSSRYVAEQYVLWTIPSAASLAALRQRELEQPAGLTNVSTAFAPFTYDLPASRAELSAFRREVESSTTFEDGRATEAELRRSLAEAPVVHAATHGVLNFRNPMFSHIQLARGSGELASDDGRLEVHELMTTPVASRLIFLSGCETGASASWSTSFVPGEDYASLAQAFLFAGTSNVIATLWRIEDEGAAVFAESFYRHLRTAAPSDALTRAQRDLMAHPQYGRPFYWAAYRLSGSGVLNPPSLALDQTLGEKSGGAVR
jgi:CHAT domain-containing protein/Tfp pilus assembly protein PilF